MAKNDNSIKTSDEETYKKFLQDAIYTGSFKDSYFAKIQLEVIDEKETHIMSSEEEEELFCEVMNYLKYPEIGINIHTLEKLTLIPLTTPIERLEEIAKIICQRIFLPVVDGNKYILEYADFCKGFAYLKATKSEGDAKQPVAFEEILITAFLNRLSDRFTVKQRLQYMVKNYRGPEEKKQNWILHHSKELERIKRQVDPRTINFLEELYTLYPEIVYRSVELLLTINEEKSDEYLWSLLEKLEAGDLETKYWLSRRLTNISAMKKAYLESIKSNDEVQFSFHTERKKLNYVLDNIALLTQHNRRITLSMRNKLINLIEDSFLKDNNPQDYIKYSIKDCQHLVKMGHNYRNPFSISDDDWDFYLVGLRSINFHPQPMHNLRMENEMLWKGLRVDVVKIKEKNNGELEHCNL